MDRPAALRPIEEAAESIRRLQEYETPAELATAVDRVFIAVERALRLRLRADPASPEPDRLTALSPDQQPLDAVVQALRTRDLISLEAAGTVHELRAAAERARAGTARPADADVALRAVARLRTELAVADDVTAGSTARLSPEPPHAEPEPPDAVPPERRGRWMAWVGAALAALALVLLALVLWRGGRQDYADAVAAFRAGRLDTAAVAFERVLEDRPEDASAMLYLGRIYRRQERRQDAAEVLGRAVRVAPRDDDVRRELGHLFMDLRQPVSAVRQYERAVELAPESSPNWIGLIRALRAAGDPRADRLLRDAPPDVQAALGGGAAAPGDEGGG